MKRQMVGLHTVLSRGACMRVLLIFCSMCQPCLPASNCCQHTQGHALTPTCTHIHIHMLHAHIPPAGRAYKAAEGRKQRKNQLAELKGLLPPSHTPLLVSLLLEQQQLPALFTPQPQQQQQQGSAAASGGSAAAGFSAAAQQAGECGRIQVFELLVFVSRQASMCGVCVRGTHKTVVV